jgi:hypothetical protein
MKRMSRRNFFTGCRSQLEPSKPLASTIKPQSFLEQFYAQRAEAGLESRNCEPSYFEWDQDFVARHTRKK